MITTSLDIIVRRALLERGYPIHYYTEYLFYSATCLRELSIDSLQIFNAANLVVDATGNIYLPDGFMDDISVCIPISQKLFPVPKQDSITPLRLHDSTGGQFIPYDSQNNSNVDVLGTFLGFPLAGWTWFYNVDAFGYPTGRFFGAPGGTSSGYQVFKAQRRIQMTEDFIGSNVVLLYISDGQSADNATQIDPQAFSTINNYIIWKISPNRDNNFSPEGAAFWNQRRLLRARLNPLTVTDIRNILHNSYSATIKT